MKNAMEITEGLNDALRAARQAARQYAVHANICRSWGLDRFYEEHRAEAVGEQHLGEQLLRRLHQISDREASGLPDYQSPACISQMLERDLQLERDNLRRHQRLMRLSREAHDLETEELMESSLLDTEIQIERLESQLDLIDEIGVDEYIRENAEDMQFA